MPCEDQRVRVLIDGTDVPVVSWLEDGGPQGVVVRVRDEGPANINFHAEIHSSMDWQGRDVWSDLGFSGTGTISEHHQVRIEGRASPSDEYETVFNGPLIGVGSGSSANSHVVYRAGDYATFLKNIPASLTYNGELNYGNLLKSVANRAEKGGFPVTIERSLERDATRIISKSVNQTFEANRHTLADVLNQLVQDRLWYFAPEPDLLSPSDGQVALRIETGPFQTVSPPPVFTAGDVTTDEDTEESAGQLRLLKNDAVEDLRPINSFRVNGATPSTPIDEESAMLSPVPEDALEDSSGGGIGKFPYAVARHETLYERAGGVELMPPHQYVESIKAVDGAERKARELLVEQIEGATGGTVVCDFDPRPLPYRLLRAQPACASAVQTEVAPIDYTINRVRHILSPTDGFTTELDVSIEVGPNQITIAESGYQEA